MHTRQLPVVGVNVASQHSAYGGHSSCSVSPRSAAEGANRQIAGPVTYIYRPLAPTNTVAVIGMVLSLTGFMTSFVPIGIVGIVMGHIARRQIRQRGERGDPMALTALWAGYLGVGFWLLFWGLYLAVAVFAIMMVAAAGAAT